MSAPVVALRGLRCTCTVAVRRGSVVRPVKQRRWSCPSCGRDKRELFMLMSVVARPVRMLTLTVRDTVIPAGSWTLHDGRIRTDWLPDWHDTGSPWGHTYLHADGTARFAPQTWCAPCLRHMTRQWQRWIRRARRLLPDLQYQWAVESTKGRDGVVPRWHRHVLISGVPRWLPDHVRDKLAADWNELAGNLDWGRPLRRHDARRAMLHRLRDMGAYLSKYLTKDAASTRVAFHHRRWGRSGGYAPQIRMTPPPGLFHGPWGDTDTETVSLGNYDAWAARVGLAAADDETTRRRAETHRALSTLRAAGLLAPDPYVPLGRDGPVTP